MIKTCTKLLRYGLKIPKIDYLPRQLQRNKKIDFYPVLGIRERKLGACILNQPSNQNVLFVETQMLTGQFVDELYRFLLSYQFDNTVENVFVESKKSVFSHGVDYKTMAEDKGYLDKISELAILFAKFNKPLFGHVSGGAKGAGAYLLSMMTMPWGQNNSFLKCDECSRGMVPLMGGSHRLARLPLHLGFYLALVGDELNAEEMAQLGFIKGYVHKGVSSNQIRKKFHEANLSFREKYRYMDYDGEQALLEGEQREEIILNRKKYYSELKHSQAELLSSQPKNVSLRFAVNQKLASEVEYQNVVNPLSSFSEEESGRTINNYFEMRLERALAYLEDHKLVSSFKIRGVELKRLDVAKIDHIFGKDSVEQILEALKSEDAEWAQDAYRRIRSADSLAIRLTFQLLKRAEKEPWIKCLETEFSVARRLIENSELELRTFENSSHYAYINEYSEAENRNISPSVIDSYFQKPEGEYKLEHKVVDNAILPVSDYYRDIPDSARAYLNKQPFVDKHNSEQVPEIKRFLKANQINFKSKVFDIDILRKHVYQKLELDKQKERIKKRLGYLAAHDEELQKYLFSREYYLFSTPIESIGKTVDLELNSIFREKFQTRFDSFEKKTANLIGLEKKIELFKKVKDIILNNILYKGYEYEKGKKGKNEYNGLIYFDEKGKNVFESTNIHLKSDQAMKQLGEDFGQGTSVSQAFQEFQNKQMPQFYATPQFSTQEEQHNKEMYEKIKFWYDQRPELWTQTYTYKEMVIQASRTSEELAGYLDWSFRNFYDLLSYADQLNPNYGKFAAEMSQEVKNAREQKLHKLRQLSEARQQFLDKNLFSQLYAYKDEQKMRSIFPYYFKESTIPRQFKRSFLSTLDSTIKEFTEIYDTKNKKILIKEELGVLDQWINRDIAQGYTQFLKEDVEYVTSYLQILFIKELLVELQDYKQRERPLGETIEYINQKFKIDFKLIQSEDKTDLSFNAINQSVMQFLYFLIDMHMKAKSKIKSPKSKLIDFMNRIKVSYEFDDEKALPYSFQGLIYLIGKDRKKIYDRFLGNKFIAEPEFLLEYITRESKKESEDLFKEPSQLYPEQVDDMMEKNYYQHFEHKNKTKHLVKGFLYYKMHFQKFIHKICGQNSFIPDNYVSEEYKEYNQYAKAAISSAGNQQWLNHEIRAVIQQLLAERFQVEKKLTDGELYLYDQKLEKKLEPESIRDLVKQKLTEEVFMVRNVFIESQQSEYNPDRDEEADFQYTLVKRSIRNPDALKKLNNLSVSEQIFHEYMLNFTTAEKKEDQNLSSEERRFATNEALYYKHEMTTRLPFKSYHRMARDLFVYPEEGISVPKTEEEISRFKNINMGFKKSLAGQKINLSRFSSQYKELNKSMQSELLDDMLEKIEKVEQL